MPNDVDVSRLGDTVRDAKVVNIDDYKAQAGTRKTAAPMIDNTAQWITFAIAIFAIIILASFIRRA